MDVPGKLKAEPQPRQAEVNWMLRTAVVVILTATVSFVAGMLFSTYTDSPHNNEDFDLFWESWSILEQEFYYKLPADKDLVYGAVQGMVATVNDPYTFFQPPQAAELDRQEIAGEFGGIGAEIYLNDAGQLVVIASYPGLPAEQAGIKADDVIVAVNGTSLDGQSQADILSRLRGDIGSKVQLTVFRPSTEEQFTVSLTRARIELPTAISRMYGKVGYVRLYLFNGNATPALQQEIQGLLDQGAEALILDLRANPGGLLDEAVSVADLFFDEGVVVKQKMRSGDETIYRSDDGDLAEDIPLVVLIDENSASASEVVSGALHDRERAVLIGHTSYGKGSVQHVHDMADNSQLHVTVAIWLTPNETPIQGQGLTPDRVVGEDTTPVYVDDRFVDSALQYMADELKLEVE